MPDKSLAYNLETTRRQPLTRQNLEELGISKSILNHPSLAYGEHKPIGVSINEVTFGTCPGKTAAERGWITYMNIGEPMIEERSNIIQPAPDTLSSRAYVNRSGTACKFEDTVEFTVSNTVNWSIEGSLQLTFGARAAAELQKMIEQKYDVHKKKTAHKNNTVHSKKTERLSYEQAGTDVESGTAEESGMAEESGTDETYTSQGTASGTAEMSAQLMMGITASVSGSLATSWTSHSTLSGDVAPSSRVTTIATQRRAAKEYSYQIPVTFAGFFAVYYDVPAPMQIPPQELSESEPPQTNTAKVVARNIAFTNMLVPQDGKFLKKGRVETVSALAVEHTVFATEALPPDDQPLYKKQESQVAAEMARV